MGHRCVSLKTFVTLTRFSHYKQEICSFHKTLSMPFYKIWLLLRERFLCSLLLLFFLLGPSKSFMLIKIHHSLNDFKTISDQCLFQNQPEVRTSASLADTSWCFCAMLWNPNLVSLVREISIIACKALVIYRNISQICGTNTFYKSYDSYDSDHRLSILRED